MTTITGYAEFACPRCRSPVRITRFGSLNSFTPPGDEYARGVPIVNGTLGSGHATARCECGHQFQTEDADHLREHLWERRRSLPPPGEGRRSRLSEAWDRVRKRWRGLR